MRERSFEERKDMLCNLFRKGKPEGFWVWVRDLFDTSVVWCEENSPMGVTKTYQADYSIGEDGAITLGDAVEVAPRTVYEPVTYSATFSAGEVGAKTVVYEGKIFESGSWPDKNFAITSEELEGIAAAFSPAPLRSDHQEQSFWDKVGGLGTLVEVWAKDGVLFGRAEVPLWLHELLVRNEVAFEVSVGIDRQSKTIKELSAVFAPRIEDAELRAVFADLPSQRKEQPMKRTFFARLIALFKNADAEELEKALDAEFATDGQADGDEKPETATVPAVKPTEPAPSFTGVEAALLTERAKNFAASVLSEGKALPAEAEHIATLFAECAKSDSQGKALFAADGKIGEGAALSALKALFAARPALKLTAEQLGDPKVAALFAGGNNTPADRVKQLVGMTDAGAKSAKESK